MEVTYPRCCGLDVHKRTVVACLITPTEHGKPEKQIRTFDTMTSGLLALLDWLKAAGCTHVAMESTGVYWKPIHNVLAPELEVLVVNAQHLKAVPGRKTDVKDAEWIADLLAHGLLRGSFVPPSAQRELRDLTRYRTTLIQQRTQVRNRLQKVLEDTNLKLGSVVSDVFGVSGRAMLQAILDGQTDPHALAELAQGRLRHKRALLEQALRGVVKPHHRFLLAEHLRQIDSLDEAIERASQEIALRLQPMEEDITRLDGIPGINRRAAEILVAEIGTDMERFPSARHLASWAGLCPGNNESAGKRLSGKSRKGSPWLQQVLVEAAQAASHTKDTYLAAQYRRFIRRMGKKKAVFAVAHTLIVIVYYVLSRKEDYNELGSDYFEQRPHPSLEQRLIHRIEGLGYQVTRPAPLAT